MSISASEARKTLFPLIQRVNEDRDAVEIVSRKGNAVLMPAEEYAEHRRTGAFCVIDPADGLTLAAGMVGDALAAARFPGDRPADFAI